MPHPFLPVTFPLGNDVDTALAVVEETNFAEYYTGLADSSLNGCSYSHHYHPSGAFSLAQLTEVIQAAKRSGKRVTVTLNAAAFRDEWNRFVRDQIQNVAEAGAESVVVSNIGVLRSVQEVAPHLKVHISSIGGAINQGAISFYEGLGADRVVLPRSMKANEVVMLSQRKGNVEIEAFLMGGGCAFAEHSCNLPHFIFAPDDEIGALGSSAILACPQRGGCLSPALVRFQNASTVTLQMLHPGFSGCGICYATPFANAGVDVLKVTGRTLASGKRLDQARRLDVLLKKAFDIDTPMSIGGCEKDMKDCLYAKERLQPHRA